jgi:hypothetical protein
MRAAYPQVGDRMPSSDPGPWLPGVILNVKGGVGQEMNLQTSHSNSCPSAVTMPFSVIFVIGATGFDVSKCPQYPLVGQNGVNLAQKWKDEPTSYLSVLDMT